MDVKKRNEITNCLKGVKNGDERALVSLYDLISPTLRFISLKYLRNETDAEDLEQDFWIHISKIAEKFSYFQNAYSYLCKVMTNMAINRYKKLHDGKEVCIEYVDYNKIYSYEDTESADRRMAVQNAINRLEPDERFVIQLSAFEDKTITQIAKEIGMSKSAVGRLKLSAQEKLKNYLGNEFSESEEQTKLQKDGGKWENDRLEIV